MIDCGWQAHRRTRRSTRFAFLTVALAVLLAGPAVADSPNPLSSEPAQPIQPASPVQPVPEGPIVGGFKLQPRGEPGSRLSDDPQLKALYEGVMRDSDPSNLRRNREQREHQ